MILCEPERQRVQQLEWELLCELDRICTKYNICYTLAYGSMLGAVRHKGFIPWDDDVDVCMLRPELARFREACAAELDARCFYQTHETDPEYFHLFDKLRMNGTVFRESFLASRSIHHGVYLDIFPVDYVPDGFWRREAQYLQFHFYRAGLMAKYLDPNARRGKKKYAAWVLRVLYAPFSLEYLYRQACKTAMRYDAYPGALAQSLCSPYKRRDCFPAECYRSCVRMPFGAAEFSVSAEYDGMLCRIYGNYQELPPESERTTRHELVELKL